MTSFPAFGDLPHLVLGVAVDRDRHPVDPGGQIVARTAVHIDGHIIAPGPEAVADIALADAAEGDEAAPSLHVGVHHEGGIALLPFRREAEGVDHQGRFFRERGPQGVTGRKVDQPVLDARGALLPVEARQAFEKPGELAPQDMEQMASLLRTRSRSADR